MTAWQTTIDRRSTAIHLYIRKPPGSDCRVFRIARRSRLVSKPASWSILAILLITLLANSLCIAGEFTLTSKAIARIDREYGKNARERVVYWQELIRSGVGLSDMQKLLRVNNFFNALTFVNDMDHWGKKDYWATPLETLISNGGDCEDFSIAKYFTLLEMGIPAEKMRLTYVKALRLNQAHMVLTYFPSPEDDPLVLDNLDKAISPVSLRDDLKPVYSFNGEGLWLADTHLSESKQVGSADRLAPWRDVIARISDEVTRQLGANQAIDAGSSYTARMSVDVTNQ